MSSDSDEEPDVADSEEVEAEAETEAAAETEAQAPVAREEPVEVRSIESRRKVRDQMQDDIERFLKSGGRIEVVDPAVSAQAAATTQGTSDASS
jgi:hypothetical protein